MNTDPNVNVVLKKPGSKKRPIASTNAA